jgi:hypothetical protein
VRTITVPALAAMIGPANWWPSKPTATKAASFDIPTAAQTCTADNGIVGTASGERPYAPTPGRASCGQSVPSANHGIGKRWRARYVDPCGHEVQPSFHMEAEAAGWITSQTADMAGHLKQVPASVYGPPGQDTSEDDSARVRPHDAGRDQASIVTAWTGNRKDQYTASNIYALCRRLTHLLDDGAEDY